MLTREPAIAGTFYPADADELEQTIKNLLEQAEAGTRHSDASKALIVPHAGLIYSGALAAEAYISMLAKKDKIKTVILLGPAHKVYFQGIAAAAADEFKTPLGTITIDQDIVADVVEKFPFVQRLPEPHQQEHSLEIQLPFLQQVLGEFKLVPMIVGDSRADQVDKIIDYLWGDESTLIVISTDLSHFHDYATALAMDAKTALAIESLQPQGLNGEFACGFLPVSGMLLAARRRQIWPERVGLCNSGDTAGDKSRVVGYGAWRFNEKTGSQKRLTKIQKTVLTTLAKASIKMGLDTTAALDVETYLKEISNKIKLPDFQAATFVTLKKEGQLRGCIGSLSAHRPLLEDIAENAFSAAYRDHRFTPVTVEDIDELEVSISLLSSPELMVFRNEQDLISQIRPGVDGMILTDGGYRGTFLPSVWQDYPEADSFFRHLKMKAGLSENHWSGTLKVERYTTDSW